MAATSSVTSGAGGSTGGPPARERLLATAGAMFYREGIRAVGVERILAEVPTTRATFYRYFPSRDDLVVAYLRGVDAEVRADVQARIAGSRSPDAALRAVVDALAGALVAPGFRGCAFLKAATEFPDPDDPVHQVVVEHRTWYAATIADLFAQVYGADPDRPDPHRAAQHFVMMRDGAMSGVQVDPGADVGADAGSVLRRGVEGLLTVLHPADLPGRPPHI